MTRDPRTLIFIFIMPMLQLLLLGYANNTEIKNVPTAVFDQSNSPASRSLLRSFGVTEYFSFDYSASSEAEINRLIEGGKAKVGVIIPPDYGTQVATGHSSQVLVLIDGSDPTIASAVLSAATVAGQAHGATIRSQQLALKGVTGSSTPPPGRCPDSCSLQPGSARELQHRARPHRDDPVPDDDLANGDVHRARA